MLIPFGVFSAGVSNGGGGGESFDLISTTILSASQASVTFDVTGLGATYRHLQVRAVAHGSRSGDSSSVIQARFNSDSGANYSWHSIEGTGSVVNSYAGTSDTVFRAFITTGASEATNNQGGMVLDILDAFSTTKYKTTRSLSGETGGRSFITMCSGNWRSTSAITSITFTDLFGGNILATSRFSIYGIKG